MSVLCLMGCYLFTGLIKEFLPHQWYIFLGFTPSVVWLKGFIPIRGLFEGLYPHPWFVWRALSPSVVWLKGFTPTVFWFISRDITPNKEYWVFVLRCRATSFLDLPNLVSTVLPLYYPMSFIHVHSFIHIQHAYWYHSYMIALSVLFFNCTESVIHNVSNSERLPIKCISSGRSHQNSRLPMPFHFPSVFPSVVITPVKVIDSIYLRVLVVTPLR